MDELSKEVLIKAKTLAEISEDVYRPLSKPNQDWKRLSNEDVKSLGLDPDEFKDIFQQAGRKQVGLITALYKTKEGEYVAAFAGTNVKSPKDWITNFRQGLGKETKDYTGAIRFAEALNDVSGPKIMTGHSKGGALASLAAAVTESKAVTFNTAGLHKNTLAEANVNYDSFKLNKADRLIVNFANNGEILQKANGLKLSPNPMGPMYKVGGAVLKGQGSFSRHGIGLVIESLDEAIQKKELLETSHSLQKLNPKTQPRIPDFKDKIGQDIQKSYSNVVNHNAPIADLRDTIIKSYKTSLDNKVTDFAFYGPNAPKALGSSAALNPNLTSELMTAQAAVDKINLVMPALRSDKPQNITTEQMQDLKASSRDNVYGEAFIASAARISPTFMRFYTQTQSFISMLVPSIATQQRMPDEQIDASLMNDGELKNTTEGLREKISAIYAKPDRAFEKAVNMAKNPNISPSELRTSIGQKPEILGELKPLTKGMFNRVDDRATQNAIMDVKNEAKVLSASLQQGRKAARKVEENVSKTLSQGIHLPSPELSAALTKFDKNPELTNFGKGYDVDKLYTQGQNILEKTGDITKISGKHGFGIKPDALENIKKLKSTVQKLETKHVLKKALTKSIMPKLGPKL